MKSLDKFLIDLNDTELAIFIAYRFDDFLEGSRNKVISEVKRRKLSKDRLTELYQEGLPKSANNDYTCLQCNSDRFHIETDYELQQSSYGGYETAIDTHRCRLCEYNPAKSKAKGLINKLKKSLGLYRHRRMKRPEIDGRMFTS